MVKLIYIFILTYFVLGGIGFYFINRHKEPSIARKSYTKFFAYFIIINILFFSITINPVAFKYVALFIIGGGFAEMFGLFRNSGYRHKAFFIVSLVVYGFLSVGLSHFSVKDEGLLLFSFLIVSIFDSFSQITGQLWGRRKLFPAISPNKTVGGLVGGFLIALISSLYLRDLFTIPTSRLLILSVGIIIFAFFGDLLASCYKRKYQVKDFSRLIPGHGGILDRFDSLIAGGTWVSLFGLIFN